MGSGADDSMAEYGTGLANFFGGLDRETNNAVENYRAELAGLFSGLGPMVDLAERAQAELDRTAATKFSIFEYFKVPEEALSDIFADLLNPVGRHGQGDRFLHMFLDEVPSLRGKPSGSLGSDFSALERRGCKIHREYSTEERRKIDIVLNMPNGRRIGIENKPFSQDLENQISDYLNELQWSDEEARVLYLSGNGRDPEDFSLPTDPVGRARCVTVPYRGGESPSIEKWIQRCWRDCEAERVRWFLKDLLGYIRRSFGSS